jgi:hypothetical protein
MTKEDFKFIMSIADTDLFQQISVECFKNGINDREEIYHAYKDEHFKKFNEKFWWF